MTPITHIAAGTALSLLLAASGCGGGGGGGRTARFSFGAQDKQPAKVEKRPEETGRQNVLASYDDGVLSPEASVQRELDKLREREKKQSRQVAELRSALDRDMGQVQREEDRLQELQRQIAQFESAQRRYQAAAMEYDREAEYRGGGMTIRTAGMEAGNRQEQQRQQAMYSAAGYGQEEVLYSGPQQNYQPEPSYAGTPQAASRRQPQPQQRPPQEFPPARQAPTSRMDDTIWDPPPSPFSQRAAQQAPAPQRPAPQMRPSNAGQGAQRSIQNLPNPTPPRQSQALNQTAPAPAPRQQAAPSVSSDVFTPDLFLSGGK